MWQCLQPQKHCVILATGLHCFSQALLCKVMPKSSEKLSYSQAFLGKIEPYVGKKAKDVQ